MPKILDRLAQSDKPLLWLDDTAYSDKLLAGGKTPWHDGAEYVAFRRKAQGLLRPDFVVIPIGRIAAAWVASHPALKEAMAAKKRTVAPARTLLADEELRTHLVEMLKGLRAAFAGAPFVLSTPSPRAWVIEAWQLAFGADADVDVGGDEADSCSVYVAEFLRSFGESGVDGLLLEEREGAEPASAEEIAWYQPVINIAGHYRWDLGVYLPTAAGFSGDAAGVQFVIAPKAVAGAANGLSLGDGFWSGEDAPAAPSKGFRFARVPADAVPEKVLERVATLRG
ncbi:MAG: hypothetical protein K0Q76_4042 [Panacagrimonas sp.]|jgi:hypothetical protein|nr:hypothetical protein [Panacagrimonas sp.]MCC2658934.1 hypothetical protein [Panacagrimonas sp.]